MSKISKAMSNQCNNPTSQSVESTSASSSNCKVFVGGFPVHLHDHHLEEYMSQFGEVLSSKILKKNGASRGFGFVTFAEAEVAAQVISKKHRHEGKAFECKYVLSNNQVKNNSKEEIKRKIFLGGISTSVTEQDLRSYFEEKFGPVKRATVNREHFTDNSRGSGFVIFKKSSTAQAVLDSEEEHFLKGKVFSCQQCFSREEIKDIKKTYSKKKTLTTKGSFESPQSLSRHSRDSSDDLGGLNSSYHSHNLTKPQKNRRAAQKQASSSTQLQELDGSEKPPSKRKNRRKQRRRTSNMLYQVPPSTEHDTTPRFAANSYPVAPPQLDAWEYFEVRNSPKPVQQPFYGYQHPPQNSFRTQPQSCYSQEHPLQYRAPTDYPVGGMGIPCRQQESFIPQGSYPSKDPRNMVPSPHYVRYGRQPGYQQPNSSRPSHHGLVHPRYSRQMAGNLPPHVNMQGYGVPPRTPTPYFEGRPDLQQVQDFYGN